MSSSQTQEGNVRGATQSRGPTKANSRVQMPVPTVHHTFVDPNLKPQVPNMIQEEFDEYGAELEPDARVWKTYVKEADKFDAEQVDGWNRSLDVTLIFAALFTAICTAFVIESSKSLKEDPTETAARRLDQMVGILLVVANVSDPSQLNPDELRAPISPDPFQPRPIDLCVNILWFFSLILSAAVSLIAMLAKEWCYLFMSGRIGDPWSQTKRRQQRWEGIEKWRMEQVIMILPSFIHLSFLSFAIGLCIYLADMNLGTAIPAALVTLGSILIYLASTIFPFLNLSKTICPYSTSISRFIQRPRPTTKKTAAHESENTNRIAVQALAWLIKTSEDPKSTDIALQAVAGADPNNANQHRELLKHSGADTMISRRLIGLDSYVKHYDELSDLYTRAQAFFQPSTNAPLSSVVGPVVQQSKGLSESDEKTVVGSGHESRKPSSVGSQRSLNRELQRKIRELRDTISREITAYVTSSNHIFISTSDNIQALRIGSTAASHCLRILQHGLQFQTQELFDSAIDLLDNYRNGTAYLNEREIHYLMIGTAMLLSSLLIKCPADFGARYVMRLLRIADRAGDGQRQLRLEYLSLPLVVYALSQHDYPGWTQPPPLSPTSRAERAIEVITHYAGNHDRMSRDSPFMINLALLELISNPEEYNLDGGDIVAISEAFAPTTNGQTRIYTFPEHTLHDSFSSSVKSTDKVISNGRSGPLGKDAITIACLTVLNRTGMDQKVNDPPLGEVYAFVVECVLTLSYSGPEAYGPNTALDLMEKFHDSAHPGRIQNLMPNLAQSLDKRGTFARLRQATNLQATEEGSNFVIKLFATGQAWFFIDLVIKSKLTDNEDWRRCLSSFVEDGHLWDSSEYAMRVLGECRSDLAEQYRAMWTKYVTRRHEYFRILFKSLP
ncbi:Protein translocase subunit SecA [Caulobacter crescentus NA1000] [Rhizoctonia solani]|uniref:Protein translocase subunit SecA [Caulobacter crescentus NA1000] n=1 Tax=Rhizoctonia solani TaxID=456999 RepID=A0A0K6G544_9AGAM|nr:Protein translocase subunit SecA [Caulobacter crescentus NA1000] [Rhizoctonia solani]